ncbi:hypothetical protein F4561_004050 [Lipingzhangella halophila]|uniref:Uncharacterized protein n=1 Tax=Lipingzhangella halophila TaxID=1783352 RepID=A0A7W7RJU1_9ACTN|nr:hypothetical protein [Lipingzhangella halophila]MBB4933230.1 hypothetical protein [Lipingzhangella halophila]
MAVFIFAPLAVLLQGGDGGTAHASAAQALWGSPAGAAAVAFMWGSFAYIAVFMWRQRAGVERPVYTSVIRTAGRALKEGKPSRDPRANEAASLLLIPVEPFGVWAGAGFLALAMFTGMATYFLVGQGEHLEAIMGGAICVVTLAFAIRCLTGVRGARRRYRRLADLLGGAPHAKWLD